MIAVVVVALVAAVVAGAAAPAPAPAPAPASEAPVRVLVLDVKAAGVDAAFATAATSALAQALGARAHMPTVTEKELKALVDTEKARAVLDCTAGAECLAEVSKLADARYVVSGTLGRVGKTTTLTAALADTSSLTVVARAAVVVGGGTDDLAAAAREVCARLFGDAPAAPAFKLAKGEKASFAVFPLELQNIANVDAAVAKSLTDIIAVEIKRVDGTTVVSIDDVAAMVSAEQKKSVLTCTDDAACLAEIGAALDVDRLVISSVVKVADTYVVSARLLDTKKVRVLSRVTESFVGPDEQLLRAVRRCTRSLLGVESKEPGSLVVATPEVGATVFVDGVDRGRTPTAPITGLAAGRHVLRVAQDGFLDWQGDIYVDSIETTAQWAPLEEKPVLLRPFVPRLAYYGLITVSALALVGGGVTGGLFKLSQDDYKARGAESAKLKNGVPGETDLMPRWQRTDLLATTTDALLVIGGVGAVAAVAAIPVVNFNE